MSRWQTTLIALTTSCAMAQQLAAQGVVTDWSRNQRIGRSVDLSTQDEAENRCIGNAVTGGLIVAGGSFLLYKLLSAGPIGGDASKDGAVLVVSLVSGAAYTVWRANKCRQHFGATPLNEPIPIRSSPPGRNRVGFDFRPRRFRLDEFWLSAG